MHSRRDAGSRREQARKAASNVRIDFRYLRIRSLFEEYRGVEEQLARKNDVSKVC